MATYYFAFVDSTDSTFSNTFKRNDADVFAFDLIHDEGQFPRLEIQIKNPRVALLSPNRKQWCWLSYENGNVFSTLFFGRMIGAPEEMQNEIIKLNFLAKPQNFDAQKESIASTLRTLPLFDPVWISPEKRTDPDTILETRPELWHINRVSHAVTLSNINSGEDGNLSFGSDIYYDSLDISYSSPPLRKIAIDGTVTWDEDVEGILDISPLFPRPLESLTGDGLIADWPDYGVNIGRHFDFGKGTISRVDGVNYPYKIYYTTDPTNQTQYGFIVWGLLIEQAVHYEASRRRSETVKFTVNAGIQDLFYDSGTDATDTISLSSDEINKPIDENSTPLVTGITRTYFKTTRGRQSLEYLLAIARSRLLSRSRAVYISGETKFENGLGFSCRKNISIEDSRLANGAAIGKISSYTLYCDGDGKNGAKFTIGCTIGTGAQTVVSSGTATYANGYVTGYQYYSGAQFEALIGSITYNDYSNVAINDDGLDFSNYNISNAVQSLVIQNLYPTQAAQVSSSKTPQENCDAINQYKTIITLTMNPISEGPFETIYNLTVSDLSIPQTITLS